MERLAAKKRRNVKKKPAIPKAVKIYHKNKEESESDYSSSSEEDYSDVEDEGKEGYKKGGYHPVKVGELYKKRYRIIEKLGWGHFSTVWLCNDETTNKYVALKIVKSASHYTEAALDEIKILQALAKNDSKNEKCVVQLLDNFEHKGPHGKHVCMVFEVLGSNLLDLIKRYDYRGIPVTVVQSLCKQILIGLDYMHKKCQVIHTDLKPENVLLKFSIPKLQKRKRDKKGGGGSGSDSESDDSDEEEEEDEDEEDEVDEEVSEKSQPDKSESEANGESDSQNSERTTKRNSKKKEKKKKNGKGAPKLDDLKLESEQSLKEETTAMEEEKPVEVPKEESKEESKEEVKEKAPEKPSVVVIKDIDAADPETYKCKIADFGNACWTHNHFTNDIQTRQYRAPEVIVGAKYDASVDMWSMGCMVFELATGDLLFEPKSGKSFDKEDDHLAQMIELLGRMPKRYTTNGKHSKDFFNKKGELKYISSLQPWDLKSVFMEKYKWSKEDAESIATFILPMLKYLPEERATAKDMLKHPWLKDASPMIDIENL